MVASFLTANERGDVQLTEPDGRQRTIVTKASAWTFDPAHRLLWWTTPANTDVPNHKRNNSQRLGYTQQGNNQPNHDQPSNDQHGSLQHSQLMASDLRSPAEASEPKWLASGLPHSPTLLVRRRKTPSAPAQFVRSPSNCEPRNLISIHLDRNPLITSASEPQQQVTLRPGARAWLLAQLDRPSAPGRMEHAAAAAPTTEPSQPTAHGFSLSDQSVNLPPGWQRCDDAERCGLSVPFGQSGYRLVLVSDRLGADCWRRSCLLFDPDSQRFASPPLMRDQTTLKGSLAELPRRWSSAVEAQPGSCGPYFFDRTGRRFLAGRFLCELQGRCRPLSGQAIGWLEPGLVVGEPG